MADAVSSFVLLDTPDQYVVSLVCISDGTGETNALKVDKSAIGVAVGGAEAVALDLQSVRWNVQGYSSVKLSWDHAVDSVMAALSGGGMEDCTFPGPDMINRRSLSGRADPKTADSTGDVLLSSVGASATATYDITLTFRKRAA